MTVETTRIIAAMSFRNLLRNKRRTLLTLLAIIAGVWSALALSSLARGFSRQAVLDSINTLLGHGRIHVAGYTEDPVVEKHFIPEQALIDALKNDPRITHFTARVQVPAVVVSEHAQAGATLVGISPQDEKGLSFIADDISEGAFLNNESDPGIVVGKAMLKELETSLGRRIVIMATHQDGSTMEHGLRITGVFDAELEATEKNFIFIGRKQAQQLLGLGEAVNLISFRLHDENNVPAVVSELQKHTEHSVTPWTTLEPLLVAVTKMQGAFLRLWFFIVVLAISFGLINTLFMSIYERKREFSLFEALGMRPRWIVLLVVAESVLLLVLGAIGGNSLALATVQYFQEGIDIRDFAQGTAMLRAPSLVTPYIVTADWITANLMIVLLGAIGSLYPAWKASRNNSLTTLTRH